MTGPIFYGLSLIVICVVLLFAIKRLFESIVLFAKVQALKLASLFEMDHETHLPGGYVLGRGFINVSGGTPRKHFI